MKQEKPPSQCVQGMDLHSLCAPNTDPGAVRRPLPSLDRLTALTALSLADNGFTTVPSELIKLRALRCLDLSLNCDLQVCTCCQIWHCCTLQLLAGVLRAQPQ